MEDKNIIQSKEEEKEKDEILIENNKIEEKKEEDQNEAEKNKLKLILKLANENLTKKNYKKAEENYNLLLDSENQEILKNIGIKIDDILINYSLSLYNQMKYEQASKMLYDILINYDSKKKEAYLLYLKILCDINEYRRAKLLIEKVDKIFDINKNNLSEFVELKNNIEKFLNLKNNNIQRQFYYNAEKEIFNFRRNLNFFTWCFYSFGALLIGHYLSKFL